ncbi:MAG TPA: hypothetical protein VGL38_14985 [bacterium]|jgi:hypothetical protein
MIGQMLLIVGLLGAWSSDGVRDGFHVAQAGQRTFWPKTHGHIVNYANYHDFVTYETVGVAMAGAGAYLWGKENPEWWRVAGVTVGTSLVGWMGREWLIKYVPTGRPFLKSVPWHSSIFGNVHDRSTAFQIGGGVLGAGLTTAALVWPKHKGKWDVKVIPTTNGVDLALNF